MDKEMSAAREEASKYKRENLLLLETLKTIQQPSQAANGKTADELELYRKILGGFHPGPKSMTYRELFDENRSASEKVASLEKKNAELESELQGLRAKNEGKEQEIYKLRNASQPPSVCRPAPPAMKRAKGIFARLFCRDSGQGNQPLSEKSEEEKREIFRKVLFSQHFSDEQVLYLSRIYQDTPTLPADSLLQLADPRMSVRRMETLYRFFCSQYHIPPMEPCESGEDASGTTPDIPPESPSSDDAAPDETKQPPMPEIEHEDNDNGSSARRLSALAMGYARKRR